MAEIDPQDPSTWPATARAYLARRQAGETPGSRARERLAAFVRARGRVTWAEFMRRALYDPETGYYRSGPERIGPRGDFITSPELHPAFGGAIAGWLRARWHDLGEPQPFTVVEAGGGTGAAAAQILAAAEPDLAAAMKYVLLELDPATAARQAAKLEGCPGVRSGIRWISSWDDLAPADGVVWANEVLDALPVHRVRREKGELVEQWVVWREGEPGGFVEEAGPLSTPALAAYFDRLGLTLPEGVTVEVNLEALVWLRAAAGALTRGWILLFDYGGPAERVYGDCRRAGTLRAYHRHLLEPDPFRRAGEQDLTADVDFTSLMRVAEAEGLRVETFTDQRRFLLDLGITERLRRPPAPGEPGHLRLASLIDPDGLGRIRVLLLRKP